MFSAGGGLSAESPAKLKSEIVFPGLCSICCFLYPKTGKMNNE